MGSLAEARVVSPQRWGLIKWGSGFQPFKDRMLKYRERHCSCKLRSSTKLSAPAEAVNVFSSSSGLNYRDAEKVGIKASAVSLCSIPPVFPTFSAKQVSLSRISP